VLVPLHAFQAQSNKHSSLLRKFVYYGQKSFITLTPVLSFYLSNWDINVHWRGYVCSPDIDIACLKTVKLTLENVISTKGMALKNEVISTKGMARKNEVVVSIPFFVTVRYLNKILNRLLAHKGSLPC